MLKRSLVTALLASALFAGAVATSTADAPPRDTYQRAVKLGFDLRATNVETKGRARAVGTVQLRRKYTKKRGLLEKAVVTARLNDICPGDGHGAYLNLRAYYPSDATLSYSSDTKSDQRGCKADAKRVTVKTGWVEDPYEIEIQLYEFDWESGNIAFTDEDRVQYSPSQFRR
jgi:hypothetical protein